MYVIHIFGCAVIFFLFHCAWCSFNMIYAKSSYNFRTFISSAVECWHVKIVGDSSQITAATETMVKKNKRITSNHTKVNIEACFNKQSKAKQGCFKSKMKHKCYRVIVKTYEIKWNYWKMLRWKYSIIKSNSHRIAAVFSQLFISIL